MTDLKYEYKRKKACKYRNTILPGHCVTFLHTLYVRITDKMDGLSQIN